MSESFVKCLDLLICLSKRLRRKVLIASKHSFGIKRFDFLLFVSFARTILCYYMLKLSFERKHFYFGKKRFLIKRIYFDYSETPFFFFFLQNVFLLGPYRYC